VGNTTGTPELRLDTTIAPDRVAVDIAAHNVDHQQMCRMTIAHDGQSVSR
jgi:hypothetical protein